MKEEKYYRLLVERYADRTATNEELEVFIKLLNEGILDPYINDAIDRDAEISTEDQLSFQHSLKKSRLWPRMAVAASVIIALSAGSYFLMKQQPRPSLIGVIKHDLPPGTNGAILTLANGKKIVLERAKLGAISKGIIKTNDSLLTYSKNEPIGYNTLETPKGRQYTVILPDGSKVWLNAATTLKYPTRFEKRRLVELNGEAYFEVQHNIRLPFQVKSGRQMTEDIGTSFNINAYGDEKVAVTTLVDGAISVNKKLLKPGQAAVFSLNCGIFLKDADTSNALAWKNGFFSFKKARIDEVMRQMARWYDVEVVYESGIPKGSITGSVYRNVNASEALRILSYLNVHYRIEGKKIIITP
jgi:transmembrane sensor